VITTGLARGVLRGAALAAAPAGKGADDLLIVVWQPRVAGRIEE
jgi:hypothetical protein